MIRVANVILDNHKPIVIALRKIFGIGISTSYYICKKIGISPVLRVSNLDSEKISLIQKLISEFEVEGNLRTRIRINIKRLKDIKCYRGLRHKMSLPCRGQRTKTNAKTRKRSKKKI